MESGTDEKGYRLAEPVNTCGNKSHTLKAQYYKNGIANFITNGGYDATCIAEPVRIGTIGGQSQSQRVYSCDGKSVNINAGGGGAGAKTGLYATPVTGMAQRTRDTENGRAKIFEARSDLKSNALTTVQTDCMVAYSSDKPIYEVRNGLITIKGKQYPVKLADGLYIIRKLTPIECERLQTMPDNYTAGISNSQRYKCLGNGWTAEVIMHILKHANVPLDEEIVVLSMYDGIATGRYCLEQLGFKNITYHAYEIDKYAMQVAMKNYSNIIQHGDAFQVRNDDWILYT